MVNLSKILSHPQALLKICRWFFFSQGGNMLVPYRYSKLQDIVCRGASLRPATTQCSSAVWRDDGGGNGLMSWDWNDKNLRIMYFFKILCAIFCIMTIAVWFGILKSSRKMMGIVLHRCDSITSRVTYDLWGVGAKQALQPYGNHCDRSTRWCAVVGQHSLKSLNESCERSEMCKDVQRSLVSGGLFSLFRKIWGSFILTFPYSFPDLVGLISFKFQWTTKESGNSYTHFPWGWAPAKKWLPRRNMG